jgi:hypothetical protein
MARYTFRYHEEEYGVVGFDAPNLEKAQELFELIRQGELEFDELPNYSRSMKGGEFRYEELSELKPALPAIPMLLKTESA